MWQLRMHCNLRPPDATPVLFCCNYNAMKSLNLSIAILQRFCSWYITLRCELDLWPWTFAVYRLYRDKTLYQMWTQSRNPQRGRVIAISIFDLMTSNMCYMLHLFGSAIIFTTFDLRQLICAWIISFFMYFMSRCDLDLWPLDLELLQHFGCHAFKLCTKFERNQIIHGWVIDVLAGFRRPILGYGALLLSGSQGCVDQTWRGHTAIIAELQVCCRVRISGCIFKCGRLKIERC